VVNHVRPHGGLQSDAGSAITQIMNLYEFATQNLVHVAALFTLFCFLFRDQIKLRIFAAIGDLLLSLYYFVAFKDPLWNAMAWSLLNVVINTAMILIILKDGREGGMSDDELSLFRNLDTLTPGQFRKLAKQGTWHRAEEMVTLTTEGEALDTLYYVLSGEVTVRKANRDLRVDPKLFIGELAFMRGRPATATVTVSGDAHYISWSHEDLEKLFKRNEDLRTSMKLLIGRDMAEKMANS
jgi:Cyclic nucleotide-binding domain